jgi:hypothetical protein
MKDILAIIAMTEQVDSSDSPLLHHDWQLISIVSCAGRRCFAIGTWDFAMKQAGCLMGDSARACLAL